MEESPGERGATPSSFLTTQWTVVLRAAEVDSPGALEALEVLCAGYWMPLYAYVRRLGFPPGEAEDLTQAFFARLLERNYVGQADRNRGRFRTFLLTALRHFISDERDRVQAWKRGGRVSHVPLDTREAEEWLEREALHGPPDADLQVDLAWAETVMRRVGGRLREEATAAGKADLFDALGVVGGRESVGSLAEIGRRFGMSEGAVKLAAYRLRQRYRELLREEVARTVSSPADLEDELRHLMRVLSARAGG